MVKYCNEELLEVLPSNVRESKELTYKQKVVLAQLIVYNGLEKVKKDGYFYRSNKDLCSDCEIQEKTLITSVRKLESLGFIERKKGSRSDGASEYRVYEKLISGYGKTPLDDNCKKDIESCSNDYGEQIAEMADRIKELENTVKKLVVRITVIEGRNYSTDIDKDKEIEKEKIYNNNILNSNKILYNDIIGEIGNMKKTNEEESEENYTEPQQVLTESQASVPIEDLSQVSAVTDSSEVMGASLPNEDEVNFVKEEMTPTDEEQLQLWLLVLNPYLEEIEDAKTLKQLIDIKTRMSQTANVYYEVHHYTSQKVLDQIEELALSALNGKLRKLKEKLAPSVMDLADYLRQQKCAL